MLTQLRPPPPPESRRDTAHVWRCHLCQATLATIAGNQLRITARHHWRTADAAWVRCPNPRCRSRERFPLARLAA